MTPRKASFKKVAADPTATLQDFHLDDLAEFKREQTFAPGDSTDYRTFYVGRDDVHGVLKYLLARCSRVLKLNMFGFDDDELNAIIEAAIVNQHIFAQITLDKSQSGGIHERKILAAWSPEMRASCAIGTSATHQISHTKGGVLDGVVAFEGSTNWSASGEGTIIAPDGSNTGRKAQNNTLLVHVNPTELTGFATELDEEHAVVLAQQLTQAAPKLTEVVTPDIGHGT
jgi:hypothetical protein